MNWRSTARDELGDEPQAIDLVGRLLDHRRQYSASFLGDMIAQARSPGAVDDRGWTRRCLAALSLQHQILLIAPDDLDEHRFVFERLSLFEDSGASGILKSSVLREGYTRRDPEGFLPEFRRRIAPLRRLTAPLRAREVSTAALGDLLSWTRQECKLTLARYLIPAEDIVRRVERLVRRSEGQPAKGSFVNLEEDARRVIAALPDEEARLADRLCTDWPVYWVAEDTPARLNSLVEHPIGTVVLVIKPPGSTWEFEIKRAGHRRDRPIGIVFTRGQGPLTETHRLDGGSMERMLQWEAGQSARLVQLYRGLRGGDPPIPRVISLLQVNTVPTGPASSAHVVEYLTDLARPGTGAVEQAERVANVYSREQGLDQVAPDHPEALAVRLIEWGSPAQAVLIGSIAFRLDLLYRYLGPDGFRQYARRLPAAERPGRGRRAAAARRFADTLLEELLGPYRPPTGTHRSYARYVAAALAEPRNRARADRLHVALARQLGIFWGTLLAVRGHSNGESFVVRNVGLRRVWRQGRWRVGLVFMDHDGLHLAARAAPRFDPVVALRGAMRDESHTMFAPHRPFPATIMDHLACLYRSDETVRHRARAALNEVLARAYRRVRSRAVRDPSLGGLFCPSFVRASLAWDRAVAAYLTHPGQGPDDETWRGAVAAPLQAAGIDGPECDRCLDWIERFAPFLERLAFLRQDPGAEA